MPLTSKQLEYLALAWQCFETEPKIDFEKFKDVAGLASANSARETMRVTKKKLKEEYGSMGGSVQASNANTTPSTPKTPTTASPRKRAAPGAGRDSAPARKKTATPLVNGDAGSDEGEVGTTPVTKKARKDSVSPAKMDGAKVKAEPGHEFDADDGDEDLF